MFVKGKWKIQPLCPIDKCFFSFLGSMGNIFEKNRLYGPAWCYIVHITNIIHSSVLQSSWVLIQQKTFSSLVRIKVDGTDLQHHQPTDSQYNIVPWLYSDRSSRQIMGHKCPGPWGPRTAAHQSDSEKSDGYKISKYWVLTLSTESFVLALIKIFFSSPEYKVLLLLHETILECSSWYLGEVWIWVMLDKKTRSLGQFKTLFTIYRPVLCHSL